MRSTLFLAAAIVAGLALAGCDGSSSREPQPALPVKPATSAQAFPPAIAPPQAADDSWETETFQDEEAGRALKAFGKLIAHPHTVDMQQVQAVAAAGMRCAPLRPETLVSVPREAGIEVRKAPPEAGGAAVTALEWGAAVEGMLAPFAAAETLQSEFKNIRVHLDGASAQTTTIVHFWAQAGEQRVQQNAVWRCSWARTPGALPLLTGVEAHDFEEVIAQAPTAPFVDVAESVLGGNGCFLEQLLSGEEYWARHMTRDYRPYYTLRSGLALGDANGDGLDDLYVCQPGALPNLLFLHNPDGTATECAAASGVDWLDLSSSALFVDLDGDGDQDLAVATAAGIVLSAGDGTGKFEHRATLSLKETDVQSLSAADYDADGDLDLYLCIDNASRERTVDFVFSDANDGGANALFANEITPDAAGGRPPAWAFRDVTVEAGLDVNNRRHSLAAAWADDDGDGDLDLYVANDYGQNCLYRNENGRFTEVAPAAGVVDFGSGMSVSWGDYDRDGALDLYVGNMFSSAGNRITTQERFKVGGDESKRAVYHRFAKGNSLFKGSGDGTYSEVGAAAAVEIGRWAWSSKFVDLDSDGWEDIMVANGFLTTEATDDL